MRILTALTLVAFLILAGCANNSAKEKQPTESQADFSDLGAKASSTKGVVLGVVVDEAIRPIKDAKVALAGASVNVTKTTDVQGRFAFSDLEPGTYFLRISASLYTSAQTSAEVVAGVENPPVVRVQIARLFSQQPYTEQVKFDGYLACAYAVGVSSTCVNDYTRVSGKQCVPTTEMCYCEGGCLKDYNVSKTGGNEREFRTNIGAGWQVLVFEMAWEPSVGPPASQGTLGQTISFFTRPDAGHWYGQGDGPNPQRLEIDVNVTGPNQSEDPALIPWSGLNDLFVFFSAGSGDVAVNQQFQFFETNFYYGIPPDGWSFVNGDTLPF